MLFKVVFKYTSLATLSYLFQEFQVIYELLNTLLVQLQNHSKLCILKHCKTKFKALLNVSYGTAVLRMYRDHKGLGFLAKKSHLQTSQIFTL